MSVPDPATTDWVPLWNGGWQPRIASIGRSTPYVTGPGGLGAANNWIPLDTVRINVGGMWSGSQPGRITIPEAGIYEVWAQAYFEAAASGYREISIYIDRTTFAAYYQQLPTVALGNAPHMYCHGLVQLNAGSYLEIALGQTSGANVNAKLDQPYQGIYVQRVA